MAAHNMYSRVLYHTCPGHIVALLNRSLAYLLLDYPELAVMDAYRAAELCCEIEVEQNMAARRARKAAEERNWRHQRNKEKQELERQKTARSSKVMNGGPQSSGQKTEMEDVAESGENEEANEMDFDSNFDSDSQYEESRDESLSNVEQRIHTYLRKERLLAEAKQPWTRKPNCYVGEGWLGEPLASIVVSDSHVYKSSKPDVYDERLAIQTLEFHAVYRLCGALWKCDDGAIADAMDVLTAFTVNNNDTWRRFGYWTKRYDQMERLGNLITRDAVRRSSENYEWTAAMMKSKQTLVKRVIYPWNTYQPNLEDSKTLEEFVGMLEATARQCAPNVEPATEELPGYVHLVATQDIWPGEALLEEFGLLNVTLPTKEDAVCATCGVLLIAEGSKSLETANVEARQCPTPYQGSLSRGCLMRCEQCKVYYCSDQCYALADDFHTQLCGVGIDKVTPMYDSCCVTEERNLSMVQSEEWDLYTSTLLRIFSMGVERQVHPLELDETKWLNGAFRIVPRNGVASPKSRNLPWRFDMCVVKPIRLLKALGYSSYELLSHYDGWVINTLFAKIIESMWITHGPKYAKTYDQQGRLIKAGPPPQPVNRNLWMGSLNTVCSMIPILEQRDKEHANAVVIGGDALECYAFRHPVQTIWKDIAANAARSNGDIIEPAIKAGDFISRLDVTVTLPEDLEFGNENSDEEMTDAEDDIVAQTGSDDQNKFNSQELTDEEDATTDSSWTRDETEECEQHLKKVSL